MTQPLHLKAYAKVNLGLDVLRRREDGYHEVRMIMQTVKLFDYITLQKNTCGQIRLSSNLPYLPLNEKNLVYRAIDTIRTAYNISYGVDATMYPVDMQELQNIQGVGAGKAKRYGKELCKLINKYCEENLIERPEELRVRTVAKKSVLKVSIIQSIDRQIDLDDLAEAKGLDF